MSRMMPIEIEHCGKACRHFKCSGVVPIAEFPETFMKLNCCATNQVITWEIVDKGGFPDFCIWEKIDE